MCQLEQAAVIEDGCIGAAKNWRELEAVNVLAALGQAPERLTARGEFITAVG